MENVSIDNPLGISLRLVLLSSSVSRAILPEEYNSTVLRPENRRARDGRDGKDGVSRWMSNYYITKYLLENWIMHSVGPIGGAQRIKEEDSRKIRRESEGRGRSVQGIYRDNSPGNTATSSRTLYTYITVYAEETKPLAENASERQSVCGNRDEMTLVLALIGPSRWRHQEGCSSNLGVYPNQPPPTLYWLPASLPISFYLLILFPLHTSRIDAVDGKDFEDHRRKDKY